MFPSALPSKVDSFEPPPAENDTAYVKWARRYYTGIKGFQCFRKFNKTQRKAAGMKVIQPDKCFNDTRFNKIVCQCRSFMEGFNILIRRDIQIKTFYWWL